MKYVIIGIILFLTFNINSLLGLAALVLAILYILYQNLPYIYTRKGNELLNTADYTGALVHYEKAYKTGRASANISLGYGMLLLRCAKPQEAIEIFNLLILNPKTKPEVKNKCKQYRALAYYKLGNHEDALEDAQEIFESYKNTVSYGLYCYLLMAIKGISDETYALCAEGYDYNSDDRDICDNMAAAHILKGEYEEAEKITDDMLERFPTFTEAYYHGAVVKKALGKNEEACALLSQIEEKCRRTFLTTVSVEEIEKLKAELNGDKEND